MRMDRRRAAGLALLAAGALLLGGLLVFSPLPRDFHDLARDAREGPVPARDARLAAFGGIPHSYDAARDRTLVLVAFCNHSPCGPGVWLEGDRRDGLPPGPWLLVPRGGDAVATEPAGPPQGSTSARPGGVDAEDAFTATYDVRAPGPSLALWTAAFAPLLAGAGLAMPRTTPRGALVATVAGLAGLALGLQAGRADPLLVVLPGALALLAGATGLIMVAVAWRLRRSRSLAGGLGAVLFAAGFLLAGVAAWRHFPPSGAGD